jgi:Fe-S-cluster containining protein
MLGFVSHIAKAPPASLRERVLVETIDLISLRDYSRRTGQQTHPELLDARPMEHVTKIEIDEEHVTVEYNEKTTRYYNVNEITKNEWIYKYNDDPEFVAAVAHVIALARKHLKDLPETIACPPGCAECCSGYEPFVSGSDVQRIADHLGMSYDAVIREYVIQRKSADGHYVGWLRKVTDDVADQCVFLKGDRSGHYYCGIYNARPGDCREFTPIGCQDVDEDLSHKRSFKIGPAFQPKHPRHKRNGKR